MSSLYDKARARVKRIEGSLNRSPIYHYSGQTYYYVFGFTKGGRKLIEGPFTSSQDADTLLATLVDGEVFEYGTRDLARATRAIKAELISRGGDVDEAMRRVLHHKGHERENQKKQGHSTLVL